MNLESSIAENYHVSVGGRLCNKAEQTLEISFYTAGKCDASTLPESSAIKTVILTVFTGCLHVKRCLGAPLSILTTMPVPHYCCVGSAWKTGAGDAG